ncbi:hypothetical protein VSX64_01375 [Aurantimonas sp. C2-6-R+9]|uniref:hypothetical protein n=1 Tax=unclassified Aurantimonas TaxID=2638230 RepID=UPI002E1896CF|nr:MULTISPECIES: hypothetical protein [unclassified Aurantimonas]MEC5289576.1 hypothetical protein [Aurantimonas sp. C2-3-R2]MEC5323210.1 hypothetical protein [Aurantimonas sp. A3-2-R12]MEC5379541.1 hypothetical protein [Aurantimonas sp. C2-6-R+9]MEC5410657.1 hypothetical protein [Aurantimonas sp. C2-4-R8]
MPEISAKTLSLLVDGKSVEIKNEKETQTELNNALQDPDKFKEFAKSPAAFAKEYGLQIDEALSAQLSSKLKDVQSVGDMQKVMRGTNEATVWAVASGSYSVASSKIALAY